MQGKVDFNDIEYNKPISKYNKIISKFFKNSTFIELKSKLAVKEKIEEEKDDDNKDAKIAIEKKIEKYYVKLNLMKHEDLLNKKNEERNNKLNDNLRRRLRFKQEENNNVFPGKYSNNYNSIDKKIRSVIMVRKQNFRKVVEDKSSPDVSVNKTVNVPKVEELKILEDGKDIKEMENINENNNKPNEQESKEGEKNKKSEEKTKKVNNSFSNIKGGIKFETYSSRNDNIFGIAYKENVLRNKKLDFEKSQGLIIEDEIKIVKKPIKKLNFKKKGSVVNINYNSEEKYKKMMKNNPNNNLPLINPNYFAPFMEKDDKKIERHNSLSSSKDLRAKKQLFVVEKKIPNISFKNMSGRDRKMLKNENYPDSSTYAPKYSYITPNNHLILPFKRNPDFDNKKYLMRKLWTSFNQTKDIKMIQLESYLMNQENLYNQRISHYKEGSMEFKGDF